MIIRWISYANRKTRRTMTAVARRKGGEIEIERAVSTRGLAHIVALTNYLQHPDPKHLGDLVRLKGRVHLTEYFVGEKADTNTHENDPGGERVLMTLTRNLLSATLEDQQFEMALAASMDPGQDPLEHIVISWPDRIEPSRSQVEALFDLLLDLCDMKRHQAFGTLHGDTDHTHLHVALNRVDPITGERKQFGELGQDPMQVLHQVISVSAYRENWPTQSRALFVSNEIGTYDRETGIQVLDNKLRPIATKADWKAVRVRRGERQSEEKLSPASRRYEQRTGLHSLQRVALEEAAPIIKSARSGHDMHRKLAELGIAYRVLDSGGAVLVMGERQIAASKAGGFASEQKLTARLKDLSPPSNLVIERWEEREHGALRRALEDAHRRHRLQQAGAAMAASAAYVAHELSGAYADECRTINEQSWKGRGSELNVARSTAAAGLGDARTAIEDLRRSGARKRKRLRRILGRRQVSDTLLLETDPDEVVAIMASRRRASAQVGMVQVSESFTTDIRGHCAVYTREGITAFVEYRDRIDVLGDPDDETIRATLRLGRQKWGEIAVAGDAEILARIARIAAEENIVVNNPELQELIRDHRGYFDERTLPERRIKEGSSQSTDDRVDRELLILEKFDPAFREWRLASLRKTEGAHALALAIVNDTRLADQLEELHTEDFAAAIVLRKEANRQRDALSNAAAVEKKRRAASVWNLWHAYQARFDDAQGDVRQSAVPHDTMPHMKSRVLKMSDEPFAWTPVELECRKREAEEMAQRRLEIDKKIARAIRDRAGDRKGMTPNAARLLEWVANRAMIKKSVKPTERQIEIEDEIEVLARDPAFKARLQAAINQDSVLAREVANILRKSGQDLPGRVPRDFDGLDLAYVHDGKHRKDIKSPKDWLSQDLNTRKHLQISRSADGYHGLYDPTFVKAMGNNVLAILQPSVQRNFEAKWRILQEERRAFLSRVYLGELKIKTGLGTRRGEAFPRLTIDVTNNRKLMPAHRRVLERHQGDSSFYFDCRTAEARMSWEPDITVHKNPKMAAFLLAVYERADPRVLTELADQLVCDANEPLEKLSDFYKGLAMPLLYKSASPELQSRLPPLSQPSDRGIPHGQDEVRTPKGAGRPPISGPGSEIQ